MTKNKAYRTFTFDVMEQQGDRERYVCSMAYEYCPLFKFDFRKLLDFILEKRPSLKGKQIVIAETQQPVRLCR